MARRPERDWSGRDHRRGHQRAKRSDLSRSQECNMFWKKSEQVLGDCINASDAQLT